MSLYQIEIDDEKIMEQLSKILDNLVSVQLRSRYSCSGKEVAAAVKDIVYSH